QGWAVVRSRFPYQMDREAPEFGGATGRASSAALDPEVGVGRGRRSRKRRVRLAVGEAKAGALEVRSRKDDDVGFALLGRRDAVVVDGGCLPGDEAELLRKLGVVALVPVDTDAPAAAFRAPPGTSVAERAT